MKGSWCHNFAQSGRGVPVVVVAMLESRCLSHCKFFIFDMVNSLLMDTSIRGKPCQEGHLENEEMIIIVNAIYAIA